MVIAGLGAAGGVGADADAVHAGGRALLGLAGSTLLLAQLPRSWLSTCNVARQVTNRKE